jgi:hypothetical protein
MKNGQDIQVPVDFPAKIFIRRLPAIFDLDAVGRLFLIHG